MEDALQRRVDELIALAAILGPQLVLEAVEPTELRVAVDEGTFDAASNQHLVDLATRVTLGLLAPLVMDGPAAAQPGHQTSDACPITLHLMLPPGYPAHEAARVEAVNCERLRREAEGRCTQRLQGMADAAAGEACEAAGQECLHQLAETLLQQLQAELAEQQAQQAAAAAAAAGRAVSAAIPQPAGCQLALLRLDHMHARVQYSRTLRRWAGELGLCGRLVFCGGGGGGGSATATGSSSSSGAGGGSAPIILILLEGASEDVREFLVRLRTRTVDVDSKGRPCRERMMDVLAQVDLPWDVSAGSHQGSGSDSSGVGSGVGSGPGPHLAQDVAAGPRCSQQLSGERLFPGGFSEEQTGVPQLAALLRRCGLEQHWRAASGLPTLPQPG